MTFTISQTPDASNEYLYPSSESSCALTPSTGTDNSALVDDVWNNPDDTDYVYTTSTSSVTDEYNIDNSSVGAGTINYVRIISRVFTDSIDQDSSGEYYHGVYGGTDSNNWGVNHAPVISSATKYYSTWLENPDTSSAWTWSNIDALRVLIKCKSPDISSPETLTLRPNGQGNYNTLSASPAVSEYLNIDEDTADDDTTYVFSDTSDEKSSYTFPNHTTESGTINNITVYFRAREYYLDDTGHITAFVRISSTDYFGDEETLTSDYVNNNYEWTQNPNTTSAWTWNDVDNLEVGLRLDGEHSTKQGRCTQLYAVVNYTATVNPEIRSSQCYAVVNYTPSATQVTLQDPTGVDIQDNRSTKRYNFRDGTYLVRDNGRASKTLVITGTETSSSDDTINSLRSMAADGTKVTLASMDDTNLNGDYYIKNINAKKIGGWVNRYDYTLNLEEI